ncbi:DNA polymerase epsilon catalytic subunit, partial [Quaeritorhiza haematococci]
TLLPDVNCPTGRSAVDLYFLEEDGGTFKTSVIYEPYFYIMCKAGTHAEVEEYLRKKFERSLLAVSQVTKEDLKLPNHLVGNKTRLLKLSFHNVQNLLAVRKVLLPLIEKNKARAEVVAAYEDVTDLMSKNQQSFTKTAREPVDLITDIREYDVPYYVRTAMDNDIRVGKWYSVAAANGKVTLQLQNDRVKFAEPVVLAFDIETTKLPLKFPDAAIDQIMMISYMIDGQGYLITNREIVSEDIHDFEYTPKPEFEGPFTIFNEPDEVSLLRRFFDHIHQARPTVVVTYNGDFFDWPFVDARAQVHGIDMREVIGFGKDSADEYKSYYASHLDCFRWVKRDSYLPQGSQGLKAVTEKKLGYNPMEIDPEDMTRFASEQPQTLAQYSVSDAVATYYLYMKYIHPFIYSMCTIIPMNPDEVEAFRANVLMPNKHVEQSGKMFEGHLLESETYVGGHVEALEAGVFRSDLPVRFRLVPEAFQQLMDEVDVALKHAIKYECFLELDDVTNYEEVRDQILTTLAELRDNPNRIECPLIYHLDVAAMYPNIILTNRLQPDAIIDESACAACDFNNGFDNPCQRHMKWSWRGEFLPAKRNEYNMIRNQLETEKFPGLDQNDPPRSFHELKKSERNALIKKRVTEYSRKVYNKIHQTKVIEKESIVCQRENPFYVNTVRSFRDRRYEFKGLLKKAKGMFEEAQKDGDEAGMAEAKKLIVVYDSQQLAHKCILNSFYGYVMRKGARWYSMEMAGIVCLTGATIIQLARSRIEQVGRPLELDTDGIWCILPHTFPEKCNFTLKNGKTVRVEYPGVMLNHLVFEKFTNHQYHDLVDKNTLEYKVHSENSIMFEVDGPYRAMILPASTQEDKLLKKRYAVFNDDGSLAELKGFEVKRRGELKLIKIFQEEIFKVFLDGSTLEECYASVAKVSDRWLDILFSKGADLTDEQLFELVSENRSMSKSLEEYGAQKSTSISTAKRLAEFLGDQMVKDKGLTCRFVISEKPVGVPVSERAIPVAIFHAEASVKKHFLRKWLKDSSLQQFDIRTILDWQYYLDRFGSVIQKLITIPAAMQKVMNPVPRVRHPDWLSKRVAAMDDRSRQYRITDMFRQVAAANAEKKRLKEIADDDEDNDEEEDDDNPFRVRDGDEDEDDSQDEDGEEGGDPKKSKRGRGGHIQDLEDMFGDGSSKKLRVNDRAVPVVHQMSQSSSSSQRRKQQRQQDEEEDLSFNPHDITVDYSAWLEHEKKRWRKRRLEKQQERQLYGKALPRGNATSRPRSGVENFLRKEAELVLTSNLEVLQITEDALGSGEFRMWVLVNKNLHCLKLNIPRIFYVNFKGDPGDYVTNQQPGIDIAKRTKTLPRSHPCMHMYEFNMPETLYRDNRELFSSLFNHPDIEGVYETQLPLLVRALVQLGCMCSVDKTAWRRSERRFDEGFLLSHLNHDEKQDRLQYLKDVNFHYLYLYHAHANQRHVFGLFSSAEQKVKLVVVDPVRNRSAIPDLGRLYQEQKNAMDVDGTGANGGIAPSQQSIAGTQSSTATTGFEDLPFAYPDALEIVVSVHATPEEGYLAINRALREYKDQKRGPTVLVLQSSRTLREMTESMSLMRDFPTMTIPTHQVDNAFPALQWQQYSCRRLVAHYLNLHQLLRERIALSRYADVPICNFDPDYPIFLTDLFLARRLHRQDMMLWWSSSDKPDLGGREQDDNRCFETGAFEMDETLQINIPGAYEDVCIEFEIAKFPFNALIQSTVANELEGSVDPLGQAGVSGLLDVHFAAGDGGAGSGGDVLSPREFNRYSPTTFVIIRNLVNAWFLQYEKTRNPFSMMMLDSFYRWLTSPAAKMYDPALLSLMNDLIRKVFMQLVAEIRKLGCAVVYANTKRLIISTPKKIMQRGLAYGAFIVHSVKKRTLFQHLHLEAVKLWDYLLWLDVNDFGGYSVETTRLLAQNGRRRQRQLALAAGSSEAHGGEEDEDVLEVVEEMTWYMKLYLPRVCQREFDAVISLFLGEAYQIQLGERQRALERNHAAGVSQDGVPPSQQQQDDKKNDKT